MWGEVWSRGVMLEVMLPEVAESPHVERYLIGKFGRRVPDPKLPRDDSSWVGDLTTTDTMLAPLELAELGPILWFPVLRRFCDYRIQSPSQLLQIATLAYI
jgi:hypothetical protein